MFAFTFNVFVQFSRCNFASKIAISASRNVQKLTIHRLECLEKFLQAKIFESARPNLVGLSGLEPPTSRLSGGRSNQLSYNPASEKFVLSPSYLEGRTPLERIFPPFKRTRFTRPFGQIRTLVGGKVFNPGGDNRDRTDDPLLAKQVLSQLSYTPSYKIFSFPPFLLFKKEETPLIRKFSTSQKNSLYSSFWLVNIREMKRYNYVPSKLNNDALWSWTSDLGCWKSYVPNSSSLHRKEVIQPLVLERLPCYDFTPVAYPTFDGVLLAVRLPASGVTNSHGVTGGVYKARERIHRGMLIRDY